MSLSSRVILIFLLGLTTLILAFNSVTLLLDVKHPSLEVASLANAKQVEDAIQLAASLSSRNEMQRYLLATLGLHPAENRRGLTNVYSRSTSIILSHAGGSAPAILISERPICGTTQPLLLGSVIVEKSNDRWLVCVCVANSVCTSADALSQH